MRKALLLTLLLAACSPQSQDQIARSAARSTVSKVVAERFPGVPVQPAIDCIIDNAEAAQIYALAADSVTGPTQSTVQIVSEIVSKPETIRCLSTQGLPALLQGGGAMTALPLFGSAHRVQPWTGPSRVVLHCGFRKTGTTFIQDVLRENVAKLPEGFAASPRETLTRGWRRAVSDDTRKRSRATARELQREAQVLRAAIEAMPAKTVLISDENLFGTDVVAPDGATIFDLAVRYLPMLEAALAGAPLELVFYTRDMARWLRSAWGQAVKRKGETADFETWAARQPSLDWESGLAAIRAAVASPVTVCAMEDDLAGERPLMGRALFRHAGLDDATVASFALPKTSNPALPAGAMDLMRKLNGLGLSPKDRRAVSQLVEDNPEVFRR